MNLFDALNSNSQALALRNRRMEVLAKNIANADTPNYKAQDVDFKAVLNSANSGQAMKATQSAHFDMGDMINPDGLKYRVPLNPSFDGNTVEMNVEQANYGRAAAQYQATLSFLESRVSGVRRALRGE